jgi:sulfotransferase family protein
VIKPVDIAIAGVQKAATSSLQVYIGQHPEVITHDEREFSFFVQDEEYKKGYEKIYPEYFSAAGESKKILIKNVGIIFWEEAMQRLQKHNPLTKIILVLRNPVDRAYSAYWYAKLVGREQETTFEKALQANNGKMFSKESRAFTAYFERGNYASQLKTLYKYFNPGQVKIILFENLIREPQNLFDDLFKFCEIGNAYRPVINKKLKGSSAQRFEWLAYLSNQQNSFKKIARELIPGSIRKNMRLKLNELNKKEFTPPKMNEVTRQELIEYYRPMVNELITLSGLDLSHWNK